MQDAALEEYEYTRMYEKTELAAQSFLKKIDPILEFYNDNYLLNDSKVKFFYFNKSNLAVKYSPSVTKQILNTDLRHFCNIIYEKFESNPDLKEYNVTTTRHWLMGIKSLARFLIIILPASLSLDNADREKERIVKKYFAKFIM